MQAGRIFYISVLFLKKFTNRSLDVSFRFMDPELGAVEIGTEVTRLGAVSFGAEVRAYFLRGSPM